MPGHESPYLEKKDISLQDLQAATKSKVYVRDGTVVLFDEDGEDSGERHRGAFLFRELVSFVGKSLGYERVLDQKVERQPGHKANDKFTTSGTDTDGFTPFGDEWDKGILNIESNIIVCAGIAEGYRLHEATGLPVACCVGEQKIAKLIKLMRPLVSRSTQIFAAVDNDKAGYIAALRAEAPYFMPESDKDFSDVYQHQGGIEAVRAETQTPIPQPGSDWREEELDRLLGRTPDKDGPVFDPLLADDERYYRAQQAVAEPAVAEEPSQLILVPTEVADLGVGGMLSIAHSDRRHVAGYQHFKTMAEGLGVAIMEEDTQDRWLLNDTEAMTLLAAMMDEGLDKALTEIPEVFTTLKGRIFEAIKDGMLDHSDLPGGAPAMIHLSGEGADASLTLKSAYDPDLRKICVEANGKYDKKSKTWSFPSSTGEALAGAIETLADNPLRRMVFMLPGEDTEQPWLIGTPERIDYLQSTLTAAAGLSWEPAPEHAVKASAPADALDVTEDVGGIEAALGELGGSDEDELEQESAAAEDGQSEASQEKSADTLAVIKLSQSDGQPHLTLHSPYDKEVVRACRKVKHQLADEFPDQPRATFNQNESGAWEFPTLTRDALLTALDGFCEADYIEIGVHTPKGVIEATKENKAELLEAMRQQLPAEPEPPAPEKAKDDTPEKEEAPKGEIPPGDPAHPGSGRKRPVKLQTDKPAGMAYLTGRDNKREVVLTAEFDHEVVAACKRIKGMVDKAHPDQKKVTFNRDGDKAWRFPVPSDAAMTSVISAICYENIPQIEFHSPHGKALASPENHANVMDWVNREVAGARAQSAKAEPRQQESHTEQGKPDPKPEAERASKVEPEKIASAIMVMEQEDGRDYLRLSMDCYDPSLAELCDEGRGWFDIFEGRWDFPIDNSRDLRRTLEALCADELGRVKMVMPNGGDDMVASPENCSRIVRGYRAGRTQSSNVERVGKQAQGADPTHDTQHHADAPGM